MEYRGYVRQLERIYGFVPTPKASDFDGDGIGNSVPAATFAASSSLRTEPGVRQVQTDHDSTYYDHHNRDQCQLKPAERCCPFKYRGPVDFVTKPSPRNRVRDEAHPHCSGNKVAEFEQEGRDICDFSDDVLELEDRILDAPLQLEKGLSEHIAEFLQLQIVEIRRPGKPLSETLFHAFARLLAGLSGVGLVFFDDIDVLVQPRNDRIVRKRCSEKLYRLVVS